MKTIKISREEYQEKANEVIKKLENEIRDEKTDNNDFSIIIFSMQNIMVIKELEIILFGKEEK